MGRQSSGVKVKLRKGLWSPEEDEKLFNHITRFGVGCWSSVPKLAALQRCGKSCRLRWINYLRPDLKRGMFSHQEEELILSLHETLGNRWAQIAAQLPGRTDNEIKNFWNSFLKKKLMKQGIDPNTHKPISDTEEINGKNCTEKSPSALSEFRKVPTLSSAEASAAMAHETHFNSSSYYEIRSVFDPLLVYEFQGSFNPTGSNYQQNPRPYDQNHMEVNENPLFGFSSMPNLMSFDHQNVAETDFSGNSTSRMSSSTSSNVNNVVENAVFSWGTDRFDSVFQCQMTEEMKPSPWGEDFSRYPITSEDPTGETMDAFQQM